MIELKIGFVFDLVENEDMGRVVIKGSTITDCIIELTDKSSDGSRTEEGMNVLTGLLSFHNSLPLGRVDPDTTFNIGLIKAGYRANTVPWHITLSDDLRSADHSTFEKMKSKIETEIKEKSKQINIDADLL